ncbi:MAG: hypothetical protein NT062_02665 [Proteobacteria bacterium]|nr:hypothetical protein [Pseudomonadota bacterium]
MASIGIGNPDREGCSGRGVFDPDLSAVRLDRELAEREAEATVRTHRRGSGLDEPLEDSLAQILGNSWARIADRELHPAAHRRGRHANACAFGGVPDRVLEQVLDDPTQEIDVGVGAAGADLLVKLDPGRFGLHLERKDDRADERTEIDRSGHRCEATLIGTCDVEESRDHAEERRSSPFFCVIA